MQKQNFIVLGVLLMMTLLYSCYQTEVLPNQAEETTEAQEALSGFRNTTEVATSSFDFQVGKTYSFRSLSQDGSQTHKLSLTLDGDGILNIEQSNISSEEGDVHNLEVHAEGILVSEEQKQKFTGNGGYWVIPFNGDAPLFRLGGSATAFVTTCDCKQVEGHTPTNGDCSAVATPDGKGGYTVTCNNVGCSECSWNKNQSSSYANALVISHPSIQNYTHTKL